jgi:hypothetical protein
MDTLADMNREELIQLIEEVVEQKLAALQPRKPRRTPEEVFASIDRNMWTPPPGAPTPQELIREDRDR